MIIKTPKKTEKDGFIIVEGLLEVQKDNTHGILRTDGVLPGENDVYISGSQIMKFGLKTGDVVGGPARLPKEKEKYLSLLRVDTVYGRPASDAAKRPQFRKMTPIFPNKQIPTIPTEPIRTVIKLYMVPLFFTTGRIVSRP